MVRRYDYRRLEAKFIAADDLSVRQLCRDEGIPDSKVSSVHRMAAQPDSSGRTWYDKRAARQSRGHEVAIQRLANRDGARAVREAEVRDRAIDLVDDYIGAMRSALNERHHVREHAADGSEVWVERPKHPATVSGVVALLDRLEQLFGKPLLVTEELSVGVSVGSASDDGAREVILSLARAIREQRSRSQLSPDASVGSDVGSSSA